MKDCKVFSINTELNNRDKQFYPKNVKNLYNILFFKKKKSSLFFFKSESKYKAKIDLKINLTSLKRILEYDNDIPEKNNILYFFKKYIDCIKYNNILDINQELNLCNNNLGINKKLFYYNNNILDLGNNIFLDFNKKNIFINSNNISYKNVIIGKLIFNETYINNIKFLKEIIYDNNNKKNNLNLINIKLISCKNLLIISRKMLHFYQNEIIENGLNFIVIENDFSINLSKYDIIITFFSNLENEKKNKKSVFFINNYWNSLVIDIESTFFKKENYDYIHSIKFRNKYILLNKYYLLDNYTSIFNLYFRNYNNIRIDINSLSNFIEFNETINNKEIRLKNKFYNFNEEEKVKYENYISKFTSFYNKNNILFTDDEFLKKFCCYPQKNLKINILNYKNISSDIELFDISGEYKNKLINTVNNIKTIIKKKYKCNVCLNNINMNNVGITTCGHYFCFSCIYKCITYKRECPTCRYNLVLDNIYYLKIGNKSFFNSKNSNNCIIDDLGTKIKSLISLIKNIKQAVIFSNFTECLELIKNNFKQLNIPYYDSINNKETIMFLNYDLDNWDYTNKIKDINNLIFIDPLCEKDIDILKIKYKFIFNLFGSPNINIYNLVINNSIEEEVFKNNIKILKSL
jgi:hypothetical protein